MKKIIVAFMILSILFLVGCQTKEILSGKGVTSEQASPCGKCAEGYKCLPIGYAEGANPVNGGYQCLKEENVTAVVSGEKVNSPPSQ